MSVEGVKQTVVASLGRMSIAGSKPDKAGLSSVSDARGYSKETKDPKVESVDVVSATLLPSASNLAKEGYPVDTNKVEFIKEQIENGTYAVDPDKIAKGLADWAGELAPVSRK